MTHSRSGHDPRLNPVERLTRSFPIVISGPSGVGKTSIVARVLERDPQLRLSVSVTTRDRRPGEIEGREYVFLAEEEFEQRRTAGNLVEWARVHGRLYGTPREPLERFLGEGYDVLLDIDTQGGQKIRASHAEVALIFILPPSWAELEARLRGRQSDPEAEVRRRLENAAEELAHAARYDYFVVNTDIDHAAEQVSAILVAERNRVARLSGGLKSLTSGSRRLAAAANSAPGAASA